MTVFSVISRIKSSVIIVSNRPAKKRRGLCHQQKSGSCHGTSGHSGHHQSGASLRSHLEVRKGCIAISRAKRSDKHLSCVTQRPLNLTDQINAALAENTTGCWLSGMIWVLSIVLPGFWGYRENESRAWHRGCHRRNMQKPQGLVIVPEKSNKDKRAQ